MSINIKEGELILIDKELNWTSFDVVNKIRYAIKKKFDIKKIKVGHAGTLDPLATGLLIICCGKMTKSINNFSAMNKTYSGKITIGSTTPSYDLETKPNVHYPIDHISEKLIVKSEDEVAEPLCTCIRLTVPNGLSPEPLKATVWSKP